MALASQEQTFFAISICIESASTMINTKPPGWRVGTGIPNNQDLGSSIGLAFRFHPVRWHHAVYGAIECGPDKVGGPSPPPDKKGKVGWIDRTDLGRHLAVNAGVIKP